MKGSLRQLALGTTFFLLTFMGAVMGYVLIGGWSWMDAIYMVVITIFGVGYGEVHPIQTIPLRLLTIGVIICGILSVGYIAGSILEMITEGQINRAIGARRMARDIATLKDHVVVCGYGRMGQLIGRKLVEARQDFVLIDNNLERTETATAMGYLVIHGNATDEEVLESAGISQARVMATVLPDDAANVFITLTARGLNPRLEILARGEFPSTEKKLRQAGADHVVLPATIGALRMAHIITHPAALDLLDRNDGSDTLSEMLGQINLQLDEFVIEPGSPLVGTRVGSLSSSSQGAFLLVAVQRKNGQMILNPGGDIFLQDYDTLIVMGHQGDVPQFARQYNVSRQDKLWRGGRF